ncbi:anthranilate synthase component I [Aphanothece hegewaldii CCALA 016]|uniref:Anthranilate synthase component 1 n=1 Tax=Aphanothece hegewaldii CCALA 016 TaxID=2107694 RepID=A0A2T1M2Y4_9CHRO|nr:anthranilate synthase component I [Aphanothece hegewaldii]PSF39093.1 anthranilate synthase component I [Aphanothece hegewaldii CCALA 016]
MISHWYWRSLPLHHRTGSEIFERLYQKETIATLLESPYPTPKDYPDLCRYSICAGSPRQMWTPKIGEILPFLNGLLASSPSLSSLPDHLPFIGGWLGWLGYDLAWEIEKLPKQNSDPLPFPVAYWYEPETFAVLDHIEQILWLAATNQTDLDRLESLLEKDTAPYIKNTIASPPIAFCTEQADYEASVRSALKYIKAGDIFQTNLSLRFQTKTTADSWQIYRNLQQINPSPFASYWRTPWGVVVSCSPERLVKLENKKVQTRPIAGTRPRGMTTEADQKLAFELKANVKEQAEHIMLVDLERNDLGRFCQWGSVYVDELLTIERYSHVMHLVSNISGILHDKYNSIDIIRSLFPGGTITGCPKVRCMEIIEELEPLGRSLFYGSCGYLDIRGNLDLNILIRTLLLTPLNEIYQVWGQVGAGIVADSDPSLEWYESLNKAEAQLAALRLTL